MRLLFYLFLLLLVSSCSIQKRQVDGNGMAPNIIDGDLMFVKKTNKDLTYGDIIYYKFYGKQLKGSDMFNYFTMGDDFLDDSFYQKLNGDYISRIVGIPGDTISIENNICILNGIKNKHYLVKKISINRSIYEEEFPNNVKIKIYRDSINSPYKKINMQNIVIPSDCYYLLGDSRSDCIDSRYIGFVSKSDIIGKVVKIEHKQ